MMEQPVVTDPFACRLIALNAYAAWQAKPELVTPQPGDLVLEITTAFRWMRHERLAPGEALGWLLRVEGGDNDKKTYVLRPIYEEEGEFPWANASFIRVHTEVAK